MDFTLPSIYKFSASQSDDFNKIFLFVQWFHSFSVILFLSCFLNILWGVFPCSGFSFTITFLCKENGFYQITNMHILITTLEKWPFCYQTGALLIYEKVGFSGEGSHLPPVAPPLPLPLLIQLGCLSHLPNTIINLLFEPSDLFPVRCYDR